MVLHGTSYETIARRYGVTENNVWATFRRDTVRRGLSWPIPRPDLADRNRNRARRVGTTIDAAVIRGCLRDAYQQAQDDLKAQIGDTVHVSARRVLRARSQPRQHPAYHRPGCPQLVEPVAVSLTAATGEGLSPCSVCCDLSITQWAKRFPFSMQYIARLLSHDDNPQARRVSKRAAVQLLKAIGEDPHPDLLNWQPKHVKRAA